MKTIAIAGGSGVVGTRVPVFSVLGKTRRYAPIRADDIAKALIRLAFDDATDRVRVVESEELHVLGR